MKQLDNILFESEIRINSLVLLSEGPKDIGFLCSHLGTDEQTLLPDIDILKEHYLISSHSNTYELTTIGKLLVDKIIPLLSTLEKVGEIEG